jgi:acetyl-CoA C-acetyltransferase
MDPRRTPVLVAAGQVTERSEISSAVALAARASEDALAAGEGLRERIERVSMVSVVFSPVSQRPAAELVELLGLKGAKAESTRAGGNVPQWLVTRAASEIAAGRLDTTLLAGAEATRSMRASDPDAEIMRGTLLKRDAGGADPVVGPAMDGVLSAAELGIRLFKPAELYALFESALAHQLGRSFEQHRRALGALMSRFSEVAASHPYAWFQQARTPEEIAGVSESNRLVAEPYPKLMNAFPNVDQAAAVIVTSLATARELGLDDRCIFVWSGAHNTEPAPIMRRDLWDAPAMRVASRAALDAAGARAEDLSLIDLYSCFPIAVEAAASALDIELDDPRGLTVTGGLPFFGGPGNNYSMHAIATMLERLPQEGGLAYVGANGGLLSKHAIGIYGASPPPDGFVAPDTSDAQAEIDASVLPVATEAEGVAEVVASTVVYGRDGSVEAAPVIADLEDGRRVAAQAEGAIRESLAGRCLIGSRIKVSGSPLRYSI